MHSECQALTVDSLSNFVPKINPSEAKTYVKYLIFNFKRIIMEKKPTESGGILE